MLLKYTHPSACEYDIKKIYTLDELKTQLSLDMIKILFTPIDFTWQQFEKPKKKQIIEEEIVGEN